MMNETYQSLYEKVLQVNSMITTDFCSDNSMPKCYLMAYIIRHFSIKNYVEIGIGRGKSLFSITPAIKENDGMAYGISPANNSAAKEFDLEQQTEEKSDWFQELSDLNHIYEEIILTREKLGLSRQVELLRDNPENVCEYLKKHSVLIGMLHVSGCQDNVSVYNDVEKYFPMLSEGAVVVFDDINRESIRKVYERVKENKIVLYEDNTFGIIWNAERRLSHLDEARLLKCKLEKLYKRLFKRQNRTTLTPLVTVGILTYNHEQYIQQCLLGVINQQGNFRLRIVVCDDYSTDHTAEKIEDFFNQHAHKDFEIISVRNPRNIGFINNLKQVVRYAENSDYFTFCEGDDYWLDIQRIQKHIVFMQSNPECVLTFNRIIMYFQEKNNYEFYVNQQVLKGIYYDTSPLIKENFIGNFSCCFYDAEYFKEVPDSLFDMFTADWMFNIWYSTLGSIGFLGEPMSVYRKHEKGLWTGNEKADNAKKLLTYIDDYNRYLNYDFDSDFSYFRNLVRLEMGDNSKKLADLIIIDDTFPHPVSGFLYQEFTSYLQELKSVKVLTTGLNFFLLGNSTADELLKTYKRKYPETYGKLEMLISPCEQIDCKLFYFSSLDIAARYLELVEKSRKPFIFTLCTNGGMAPDNDLSGAMLKSVMGSPSFKKVIVMQKAIYDYLIEKKFCLPDKIEYNYENQISPKVELLKMALAQPFFYNEDDFQKPVIADIPLIDTCLFVDTADGFSENNVVEMLFERSEMLDLCFDLTRFKGLKIKSLRWDPLEGQYIEVSGLEAYYTDKDGVRQDLNIISFNANQFDDQFLFLTRDPCFTFNIDDEAVTVNISCKMRIVETDEIINTWCQQIDQTLQEIHGKQNVLIERHRMNHLLKWIKKIFYKDVKRQS